jgi:hypothetical protein
MWAQQGCQQLHVVIVQPLLLCRLPATLQALFLRQVGCLRLQL